MKIGVHKGPLSRLKGETIALFVGKNIPWKKDPFRSLNEQSSDWLRQAVQESEFIGKEGEIFVQPAYQPSGMGRIIIVGLGDGVNGVKSVEQLRRAAGVLAKKFKGLKIQKCTVCVPWEIVDAKIQDIAQVVSEGLLLGLYEFIAYKTVQEPSALELVNIHDDLGKAKLIEEGIKRGVIFAQGACYARDLVNEPPSRMSPRTLAEEALKLSDENKRLFVEVFTGKQLAELGAGALEAVGRGSDEPAHLIRLHYRPQGGKPRASVCLIGKGVTFDSGGLSLKTENSMETMKCDMAGAAAVLGVFKSIAHLKPRVEVHGLIPACENMPSGKAVRPGDIIKTVDGKSVEVLNTDAEGRLVLADALGYAAKILQPTHIIDLATLTGACVAALGEMVAGVFSNNERLQARLIEASRESGEPLWRLPLVEEYKEQLKSQIADIKNITGSRWGGAITAALFLREFAGETPWAHLDIAGPAWDDKGTVSYIPKGGTGFGVRTILNLLEKW